MSFFFLIIAFFKKGILGGGKHNPSDIRVWLRDHAIFFLKVVGNVPILQFTD